MRPASAPFQRRKRPIVGVLFSSRQPYGSDPTHRLVAVRGPAALAGRLVTLLPWRPAARLGYARFLFRGNRVGPRFRPRRAASGWRRRLSGLACRAAGVREHAARAARTAVAWRGE